MDNNGLTADQVKECIEDYLESRGVFFKKNVAITNRKKLDYVFKNNEGETVGIYLLLWKRPITYKTIFNLVEWSNREELDRVILVCRIMGERAREVIEKESDKVSYILESWFRRGSHNPLLAAF
ncbi:MAG: hypothetical protein U9O98_01145 [Asgard group archaeon]|nr:hypothetical protein [Asgard group archaeon]